MPRGKAKPKQDQSKLLKAMQFLSVCQDSKGSDASQYCSLKDQTAIAFNGIIAAGIKIDEALDACPQTEEMIKALSRSGPNFQITQLSPELLQVRSDVFEAYIPCVKRERLPAVNPDAATMPVNDSLIKAIATVAPLTSDKGDVLEACSIQISKNSVLATNREMVMEVWHGLNLTVEGFLIPKVAAVALNKIKKVCVGIGVNSNHTFPFSVKPDSIEYEAMTFWFEDDSWFRTNLFKGKWREDVAKLLKLPSDKARPVPELFFGIVRQMNRFSQDGKVYCYSEKISSHSDYQCGAAITIPVEHGPSNKIYKAKNLLLAAEYCNIMDESASNFTMFYGGNVRCAVWHDELLDASEINDEDIPF